MRAIASRPVLLLAILWSLLPVRLSAASDPVHSTQRHEAAELNNRGITVAKSGDFKTGVELVRRAVRLAPDDAQYRTNLSGMLTDWAAQLSQYGRLERAEQFLREAIEQMPENGAALVQLGDLLYFQRSQFDRAVELWKQAHGHLDRQQWPAVADRITQAERDQRIERTFSVSPTRHFDIRVQSPHHPAVRALGQLLEEEYTKLHDTLGEGPSKITVIVYTAQDLKRLYNQRDGFVGFYDGRLRLRWNEIVGGDVRAIVAHELAHAFLHRVYGVHLPNWVHEGFAQLNEGPRLQTEEERGIEERVKARTMWIPLAWIDRRFSQPSGKEDVQRAYVESRLVVEELVGRYGMERFKTFLRRLSKGLAGEAAFDQAFSPARWVRVNRGVFD